MAIRMNLSTLARWSLAVAAVGGLSLTVVAYLTADQDQDAHKTYRTCLIKWGNAPTPATHLAAMATYDAVAISEGAWETATLNTPTKNAFRDELVVRNPNIILGEYLPAMHVKHYQREGWENYTMARSVLEAMRGTTELAEPFVFSGDEQTAYYSVRPWPLSGIVYPGSWSYDWYNAMKPYLARTNANDPVTGQRDTASAFLRNYCTNLTTPGAIDAAVGCYTAHKRAQHGKAPLWIFYDFITVPYPDFKADQPPAYAANEAGDMDLDQDGNAHDGDLDERSALSAAFVDMLEALAAAMPELILVPNGHDSPYVQAYATVSRGWYAEGFPYWHFGSSSYSYSGAIDPTRAGSLWSRRYGWYQGDAPMVILDQTRSPQPVWPIAAMFDAYVSRDGGDGSASIPASADRDIIGAPVGPVLRDAGTGGIKRQFEDGLLRIYNYTNSSYTYSIDGVVQ